MDWVLVVVGSLLILLCLIQLTFWVSTSFGQQIAERRYWQLQRQLLRAKIAATQAQRDLVADSAVVAAEQPKSDVAASAWKGWRRFQVNKLVRETSSTTSVYLVPQDGLELPEFKPGQFLTFKFEVPGQQAPQIRCYSLSSGPQKNYYRITVKDIFGKPQSAGGVSHFINWQLAVGELLDVKAPSGDFYLDTTQSGPAILLGGGVGITPLMSMIETVLQRGDDRDLLLFYGLRHGGEHIFKERIRELAAKHQNLSVFTCYSNPEPSDQQGVDYHFEGRVSIELLKKALPNPNFHFYLCGPAPFMTSLHRQLQAWGVSDELIHYESFGPATIASVEKSSAVPQSTGKPVEANKVVFSRSNKVVDWTETQSTLLEAGLAAGVAMSSGCRAGQCGACQTKILRGDVSYPRQQPADVEAGHCLPCIAVPKPVGNVPGEVVLDV